MYAVPVFLLRCEACESGISSGVLTALSASVKGDNVRVDETRYWCDGVHVLQEVAVALGYSRMCTGAGAATGDEPTAGARDQFLRRILQ